jgi:Tfp pilus assembly protein PilF
MAGNKKGKKQSSVQKRKPAKKIVPKAKPFQLFYNRNEEDPLKRIFWLVFGGMAVVMLVLSLSTGINGDDYFHHMYGEKLVNFYTSFGSDKEALFVEKGKMHNYGGILDIPATATNRIFGFEENTQAYNNVRHIYNTFFGALALLFTALIVTQVFGWKGGIITLVIMFLSPRFLGHAVMNPRDIPMAAGYAMGLYYIIKALKEMPAVSWRTGLGFSLGLMIMCGIRIGGILLIPYFILFTAVLLVLRNGTGSLFDFSKLYKHYKPVALFSLIGLVAGILFWPHGLVAPFKNIPQVLSTFSQYTTNIRLLFDGDMVWGADLSVATYVGKWIFASIPLAAMLGLVLALVFFKMISKERSLIAILLLLFTFLFPLIYVSTKDSTLYDGWRHLTFTYTALAAIAGIGWSALFEWMSKKSLNKYIAPALLALFSIQPLSFIANNPQHFYAYFNPLVGGMKGTFGEFEQDYWGLSVKAAFRWLEKEGLLEGGTLEDPVVISSNFPQNVKAYREEYGFRVKVAYNRLRQRFDDDWDYAIHVGRFIDGAHLRTGTWPSKRAIHTIRANGVVICAIYANEDKNAFKGQQAFRNKDYDNAINFFTKEVANYPNNEIAWSGLAESYRVKGISDKAKHAYEQVLRMNPERTDILNSLGILEMGQGQASAARNYFRKSIEINERDPYAWYYLASMEYQSKNYAGALTQIQKAIEFNPGFRRAYELMVQIYEGMGDKASASRVRQALNQSR